MWLRCNNELITISFKQRNKQGPSNNLLQEIERD